MSNSAILGLLASSLILSEERGLAHSVSQIQQSDGYEYESFFQQLFAHVQHTYPHETITLSQTDAHAALGILFQKSLHLTCWYRQLLNSSGVMIEWRDRQPSIIPTTIARWEWLANQFDPDSLLSFDLASRYRAQDLVYQVRELDQWQAVPRVIDHELKQLWANGLSDLHVHAGGVRVPQAVWQEIMSGHKNADLFKELSRIYKIENRIFLADMEEACNIRESLLKKILKQKTEQFPQPSPKQWWRWSSNLLQQERCLLVAAWSTILENAKNSKQSSKQTKVTHLFDRYLRHKHRYCRLARQPIFDVNSGLRYFDTRYFRALKSSPKGPRRSLDISYASSSRHLMVAFGDACAYLIETQHLKRLEIRTTPQNTPQAYLKFFKYWYSLQKQIKKKLTSQEFDLRIAIHFIRSKRIKPIFDPDYQKETPVAARILKELDRQSAALRLALNSPEKRHQKWMKGLCRIDVAGQERDAQASLFGLHMRLVRGDLEAITYLENIDTDHPYHEWLRHWFHLRSEEKHRPRLTTKRLGISVHAGEDFADVLDGLHQISSVLDGCNLSAGDGIGHGLALTAELQTTESAQFIMIPRGADHDSLCWLFDRICNKDESNDFLWTLSQLRSMIEKSGYEVFYNLGYGFVCDDFVSAWRYKLFPQKEWGSDKQKQLIRLECSDEILRRRQDMIPLDPERQKLRDSILWAQRDIMKEIKQRRVVIEMNPASNLRISGSASLEKSPTVGLAKEVANGLLACINTDDPGVFSSCLENEYALLLGGLISDGMTDGEARSLLDQIRAIGMHTVY